MQQLLDFLFEHPILLLLLLGPLLSGVGTVLQRAAKRAEENRRRQQGGGEGSSAPPPQREPRPRREPRPERPMPPPRPVTADEAAAELRRLLGGESQARPEAQPTSPPLAAPIESMPSSQGSRLPNVGLEAAGELPQFRQLEHLQRRPDPTVGQGVAGRRGPMSGAVGARELGTIGGRVRKGRRGSSRSRRHRDLVNTHNLPSMILAQEILGRPVGMRERQEF